MVASLLGENKILLKTLDIEALFPKKLSFFS